MPASTAPPDSGRWLILAGVILTLTTFAFDLLTPLGITTVVPYELVVLLGLWARHRAYPLFAAAAATILTGVGFFVSPPGDQFVALLNRPLMIVVLWVTAALIVRYRTELSLREETGGALQRSLKELSDTKYALDQSAIVASTDQRGIIRDVNDQFCRISKYSREELIGQDHRIVNSGYHPKEFIRDLWRTIASGQLWRGEIRNRAKDGTIYWVDTTIVPFLDDRGKPYQYMAIRYDITERKRAEERLREQAALTRLGEMAAVVAHELRNPLAGVRGALQIIGQRLPSDGPEAPIVREMLGRLDSLNHLVQDLLLFARPRVPQTAPVSLAAVLRAAASLLRDDPAFSQMEVDVTGADVTVTADREMLKEVFLNLLLNAAQAMGGTGCVRFVIDARADECRVEVIDAGPGIPPEMRDRIFEPFFTTKHRGTGLGLAITRRVVELHGGTIAVAEDQSAGTTIVVTLPLTPGHAMVMREVDGVQAQAPPGHPTAMRERTAAQA
jgi:PAS domain S-box-containing protein